MAGAQRPSPNLLKQPKAEEESQPCRKADRIRKGRKDKGRKAVAKVKVRDSKELENNRTCNGNRVLAGSLEQVFNASNWLLYRILV